MASEHSCGTVQTKAEGKRRVKKTEKQSVSGTWEDLHKPAGMPDSWHKDNLTQRPQKEDS